MTRSVRTGASGLIADFASSEAPGALDARAEALVTRALADTVAVAIAARRDEAANAALRYAQAGAGAGGGQASVWGSRLRLPTEAAAFYNGVSAHLLDYDDVTYVTRGHVSVALVPALIALAQARGASSERLLSAYNVGFEVACKLGRWLGQGLYQRGWHPTSVIGVVAGTAACGHLVALGPEQLRHALGLAVAQASGTRESFGTLAKPFHAGHCAVSILRAVALAQAGFTAAEGALDGVAGLARLYADVADPPHGLESLGGGEGELLSSGIEVKRYANCFATHGAIDALRGLRATHGFSASEVERVEVVTSSHGLRPLIGHAPTSGLESKFSMAHALAVVLVDGAPLLQSFSDAAAAREDLRAWIPRISAREGAAPPEPLLARVTVTLADGRACGRDAGPLKGSEPIARAELEAKVADCFAWGGSGAAAEPFVSRMLSLRDGSLQHALDAAAG